MSGARHIAAALVALAGHAALVHAQDEARVLSPQADSVAVTIYRDGLAFVTETRTVDLPAGPVTLVVEGVVETLLPQSAIVRDVERPLAESNLDFDRLTPYTLLARSIGTTVTITRTNPATGRVTREPATIVAVERGVVLRIGTGVEALYCAGLPERLELAQVPGELVAKPRLSVRLAAGVAGRRTVRVSYLAHGFGWSSDYVAHLNERSDRLALTGWATLTNSTNAAFAEAEVQLVAGVLNLVPSEEGGSAGGGADADPAAREALARSEAASAVALLRDCFAAPLPPPAPAPQRMELDKFLAAPLAMRAGALEEIVVTAARVEREEFGDYQLYRLPWRTDLGPRQTKQVLFLDEDDVRVERFYGVRLAGLMDGETDDVVAPNLVLRFDNTAAAGLGEPLPRGVVRVFEPYAGHAVFAGEAEVGDRPVGLPVELVIGRAQNVLLEVTAEWNAGARARTTLAAAHRIVNNKGVPIDVEIRHGVESYLTDAKVDRSSKPMRRKYGDFAWRFVVPPGEDVLTYQLSAREPR